MTGLRPSVPVVAVGVFGLLAEPGIGLTYIVFALILAVGVVLASRIPALAHFDRDVPDARPDDLVGLEALRASESSSPMRR